MVKEIIAMSEENLCSKEKSADGVGSVKCKESGHKVMRWRQDGSMNGGFVC
jgi:hypothetical protein